MASANLGAATNALLEYYRIKYPDRSVRIEALRADYLCAYEAKGASIGKTLSSTSADGQSASWQVSLSVEEQLSVMASALQRLEGRAVTAGRLYAR